MNKSVEKLLYLLKRTYNKLTIAIKKSYFVDNPEEIEKSMLTCHFAGNLGLWLSQNSNFRTNHKLIFDEFAVLTHILESKEFNRKDIFNILTYILNENINQSLLEEDMQIYNGEIDDVKYINTLTTPESLRGYADDETYYDTYVKIQKIRYEQEDATEKHYQGLFDKEFKQLSNLKEQHAIIKSCYFDVKETFTAQDVDKVLTALKELGVSEYCVQEMKEQFLTIIAKRNKKNAQEELYKVQPKKVEVEQPTYTRREYKIIIRELSEYYDFEESVPKRPISHDEIVYCMARLKKIGWNELSLEVFLRKVDKYNLVNDPILHCQNLLIRLKKHKTKIFNESSDHDDITNAITALEEYLLEYSLSTSEKEQEEWKELIKSELVYSNRLIPKTI